MRQTATVFVSVTADCCLPCGSCPDFADVQPPERRPNSPCTNAASIHCGSSRFTGHAHVDQRRFPHIPGQLFLYHRQLLHVGNRRRRALLALLHPLRLRRHRRDLHSGPPSRKTNLPHLVRRPHRPALTTSRPYRARSVHQNAHASRRTPLVRNVRAGTVRADRDELPLSRTVVGWPRRREGAG